VIFRFTYALIPSGAFTKKKFGSSGLLLLEGTIDTSRGPPVLWNGLFQGKNR
jgi:hypothetical protein